MNPYKPSERGQALVLIAFALIGLIGMTALAIDGGNFFSDRRHAQNTADAAALAAGLKYLRTNDFDAAKADAMTRAESNGYDNNEVTNIVQVITPPESGSYAGVEGYMQVIITSHVKTYLAPIVGITQLTNRVDAVVYVDPTTNSPIMPGNAILSLNKHDCPAVNVAGNAAVELINGGVFVSSDCANNTNKMAFDFDGGGGLVAPGLCTVGPNDVENDPPDIVIGSIQSGPENCKPDTEYIEPNITCSGDVSVDPKDSTRLLPGNFPGSVKAYKNKDFPPAGIEKLAPGIYCINEGDFALHNGVLSGNDVIFFVKEGNINLNGGVINLNAPKKADYPDMEYAGLLFALPSTNDSPITINGNATMKFTGTILGPSSHATINGTSDSEGMLSSQIIVDTVDISGGGDGFITYDPNKTWSAGRPPKVKLME